MAEAFWERAPEPAPASVLRALPDVPPLVVHLAAHRLRAAEMSAQGAEAERTGLANTPAPWPDAARLHDYLFEAATAPLPPCRIPRLDKAAERLARAVERGERVGIHGDYDADGVTSAALLTEWLEKLGLSVETVLPLRLRDGYGLGVTALERLAERGCRLVVAVDCGITSLPAAARARELAVELIILDHHEPGENRPEDAIVVDPKLPDGAPGDHCLAAAGLAYRLCEKMADCGAGDPRNLPALLELVALGTVADVCPLTGQNRLLVARGLLALRHGRRPGVVALAQIAAVKLDHLRAEDIAFKLAPRLNAAGRLDDPRFAFDLLRAPDAVTAGPLAARLQRLNSERQAITTAAFDAALAQIGVVNGKPLVLVATGEQWHPGIVGLVAGKLAERYHRPAFALTLSGGRYVGSARSIEGFDLAAALHDCRDLLVHGGGHARAGGLTVETSALDLLRVRLEDRAAALLTVEQLRKRFRPEALVRLSTLTPATVRALEYLGPFGEGNPQPLLLTERAEMAERAARSSGKHTHVRLSQYGTCLGGIVFQKAPTELPPLGALVDALYTVGVDTFAGEERVEIRPADLRPSS